MVSEDEFLSIREAAEELGYTDQHTRLLARSRKLRGRKLGRDWMVLREAVAEYITQRSTAPLIPASRVGRPKGGRGKTRPEKDMEKSEHEW